jgi:hypothetical protein
MDARNLGRVEKLLRRGRVRYVLFGGKDRIPDETFPFPGLLVSDILRDQRFPFRLQLGRSRASGDHPEKVAPGNAQHKGGGQT